MATLQEIFNKVVMENETCSIAVRDKASYNSTRVALVRKFSGYRSQCQSVGIESYDNRFISATYKDATELAGPTASFALKWKDESKRVSRDYKIFQL